MYRIFLRMKKQNLFYIYRYHNINHIYFHNLITPSLLEDISTGYFCVLHISKSVTTLLCDGSGISGPDLGE